jgi:hypothetical protein
MAERNESAIDDPTGGIKPARPQQVPVRFSADRMEQQADAKRSNPDLTADRMEQQSQVASAPFLGRLGRDIERYVDTGVQRFQTPVYSKFDFSSSGEYGRAFTDVALDSSNEYYDRLYRYEPSANALPSDFSTPRSRAAQSRVRRQNALSLLATSAPDVLDSFPTLRGAIAQVPDLNEDDVRNLINLNEMETAWRLVLETGDEGAAQIFASMNPVQQAGFTDYVEQRLQSLFEEAQKDPSWLNQGFEYFMKYGLGPMLDGLFFLNETVQQGLRANFYAIENDPASAATALAAGPVAPLVNAFRYWDSVASGTHDENKLQELRTQHGGVVDVFLDLNVKLSDGLGNAEGRWMDEWIGTEYEYVLDQVINRVNENQELTDIGRSVAMTRTDQIGQMFIDLLPQQFSQTEAADLAAGAINFGYTVGADPTIFASKAYAVARASRYALTKLGVAGGADIAFKYNRTRRLFDALGKDLGRVQEIKDPGKRALARLKIDEQYSSQLPTDVIDDLANFNGGVRSAADAYDYFKASENFMNIAAGGPTPRFTQSELFARLDAAQKGRRTSLIPGKSVGGVIASNVRRTTAFMNPATKGDVSKSSSFLPADPGDLATVLAGEEYGAAVGMTPRITSSLLEGSKIFGYKYSLRGVSARLDRLFRNWAKAPFNMTVDISSAKDATKIYEWSRAFLPRYHASIIADAFRNGNQGTRKRIIDGLQNSSSRARGVQFRSPDSDLLRFSSESKRGRRYSPKIEIINDASGAPKTIERVVDAKSIADFGATRQKINFATVENRSDDIGDDVVDVYGKSFDAPEGWFEKTFPGVNDVPEVAVAPAWEGGPPIFHGSSRPIGRFLPSDEETEFAVQRFGGKPGYARFDEGQLSGDQSVSLYGGIFYGTVNRDVAKSYQKKSGKRSIDVTREDASSYGTIYNAPNDPRLYNVEWAGPNPPRFLDLDEPASQRLRELASNSSFYEDGINVSEDLLPGLQSLIDDPAATGADILDYLRQGSEGFDNLQSVWMKLADEGWDGYKHIGGLKAGRGKTTHDVYIFFDEKNIQVKRVGEVAQASTQADNAAAPGLVEEWARDNGYSVVRYNNKTVALPEMAAWGANDPAISFQQALKTAQFQGKTSDEAYVIATRGEQVPNLVLEQTVQSRSMSAFPNPNNPDEFIEMPLHLWQASNEIAMPNFNEIYEAGVNASVFGATLGWTHGAVAQKIVDAWSLFNLAGPRYFLRNATEDYIMYAMTSGNIASLQRGRRMSAALRESRGGKRRGLNRIRSRSRTVDLDSATAARWSAIKASFSEEDIAKAQAAAAKGDLSGVRRIAAIAMGRMKFSGMDGVETQYFLDYITLHGQKMIDEIAGTTRFGSSAAQPGYINNSALRTVVDEKGNKRAVKEISQYTDISPSTEDPLSFMYWHKNLVGAADNDGIIGKIAIANLDKADDEIVPLIVRALEADEVSKTGFGYKERLASLNLPNVTKDQWARRYISDVRNLFNKKDGTLNRELWEKVATIDPKTGERVVRMANRSSKETSFAVEVSDLMDVPVGIRPSNVLGEASEEVPVYTPGDMLKQKGINFFNLEKWWEVMGDQYAVFAREPIFFANYIEARKALAPLERAWTEQFGEELAMTKLASIATDRAYLDTLAYTDNPLDRTLLAWNARNVARYYRATEDFARRMLRVGKNYPVGFWKVALVYDTLEETGFVWSDSNDDKFFVFPGSDIALSVISTVLDILPGDIKMMQFDNANFEMRGMVRMIAPGTDPNQAIPSLSSPIVALPVKGLISMFPALESFEQALLGEYSEGREWWQAMIPGHIMRALNLVSRDERNSMYASTIKDAMVIAAAADKVPDPDASDAEKAKFFGELQTFTSTVLITRLLGGVTLNTAPRPGFNDVTDFARDAGFVDMDSALKSLIDAKTASGAFNPVGEAMEEYVSTFGLGAAAYTSSKYETGNFLGSYSGTSMPATEEARIWAIENNDLITDDKYRAGATWLMPRTGEFSSDMWRYSINLGARQPKATDDFYNYLSGIQGTWLLRTTREENDDRVAVAEQERYQAILAGDQNKIAEMDKLIKRYNYDFEEMAKPKLIAAYPYLENQSIEFEQNSRALTIRNEIRPTLDYVINVRDEKPPVTAVKMQEALDTFDDYIFNIDTITGRTKDDVFRKKALRAELKSLLNEIGSEDTNTKLFVDIMLIPMVDRPEGYVSIVSGRGIVENTQRILMAGGLA